MLSEELSPSQKIDKWLKGNTVVVFSKSTCPYCSTVKDLLTKQDIEFYALELDLIPDGQRLQTELRRYIANPAVPLIFVRGEVVGDCKDAKRALLDGSLKQMVAHSEGEFDYDLAVIGGGSGGLAAAQEAAALGARVVLFDWVEPTPLGTKWGLGGTCLNVGCVPKQLMHRSAEIRTILEDAEVFGWQVSGDVSYDWTSLVGQIQKFIKAVSFNYQVTLNKKSIKFVRARASLASEHQVRIGDGPEVVTTKHILIATGLRPKYADLPGDKELCITSDDLFWLKQSPGKTIIIGASYVALECAGVLCAFGCDVTVMVRDVTLRGFDQQMAGLVTAHLENYGVTIVRKCVPVAVERTADDRRLVRADVDGEVREFEAQTVLLAVGRFAELAPLGLEVAGVAVKENRVVVDEYDGTNVASVHAVGDVALGRVALTPVAILGGVRLARRLFGGSSAKTDYSCVPTTIFTPLEYAFVGLSEEAAVERYGAEDVEVYHSHFLPLRHAMQVRDLNKCYAKLICVHSRGDAVVGLHVTGPEAGEAVQGFALAVKMGAALEHFQDCVGVHPTTGEIITKLTVTKSSGLSVEKTAC